MTCPDCERYKASASMWRNKAYELGGTPLPWNADAMLEKVIQAERTRACRIVTGLCISDNNAREINEAIRAQGQRTTQFCAVAEQARQEEREACARLCEDSIDLEPYPTLTEMAVAIRARGQTPTHEDEEYGNPSFG